MKKTKIYAILLILVAFVAAAAAQEKTGDEVIKISTSLVSVPVIVSDKDGRYIANLRAENFEMFQDGEKQQIEFFASEEAPITVALLLDTSRSTQHVLGKIKKAAREFIKFLRPADRAMIVSFDSDVEFLSGIESNQQTLIKAIDNAAIGESVGTVLRDAIYETLQDRLAAVKGRKAVILLTDGKDFGSSISKPSLLYRLEESDTMVYSIFYETGRLPQMPPPDFGERFPFPNRRGMGANINRRRQNDRQRERIKTMRSRNAMADEEAKAYLGRLAYLTAGRVYLKNVTDLKDAFVSIAEELRKQYLIGFYPENQDEPEGTLHQIKIRVNHPNAAVRSKNSYRSKTR